MKKFIAAVLSAAITLGCMSSGVYAEATSTKYTIDAATKTVSKVAPLTTVATFKSNITGATVEVVNVDGQPMADTAYATENVFAKIDGELYNIDVKYGYEPIANSKLEDKTSIYDVAANSFKDNVINISETYGFVRIESHPKVGYGSDNAGSANTETQTVKATKDTIDGEEVYVVENNSNKYSLLRSHYSPSTNYSTTLNSIRDTWATGPIITSFEFEADKLGNISLYHNTPSRNTSDKILKGDGIMDDIYYKPEFAYVPSTLHFLEDGSVKLGGTYGSGYTAAQRTPIQETDFKWEAGKKYNVSIVQRYLRNTRNAYVDGVYVNGTKIFPNDKALSYDGGRVALQADGTFKMGTKSSTITHGGDISSILIGTAPKTADENLKVYFSDIKVYGLATLAEFNPAITKVLALENAANITVTESDDAELSVITDTIAETVAQFKAKYPDVVIGVYDANGALVSNNTYLATGMRVKIASADGLQGKTYKFESKAAYTVNSSSKVVSGVAPYTTVSAFLANFNGGKVVNIDGSELSADAYATENVSFVGVNGETYKIKVKYIYAPIADTNLLDGAEIYNMAATNVWEGSSLCELTRGGFERLEKYAKLGYGKDNEPEDNTVDQKVKAVKTSKNSKPVYVIDNDSNNYAYLRSHYQSHGTHTALRQPTYVNKPVVTTATFTANGEGTVSLHHNVPGQADDGFKSDKGMDRLIASVDNPYVGNAVHFMDNGKIMIGGTYADWEAEKRMPAHDTNMTWEPGKEYTVTVVQRLASEATYAVEGVYINGTKVFPFENSKSSENNNLRYHTSGTYAGKYAMTTRDTNNYKYKGGISSVMFGTAPKTAGENMSVELSDLKVYAVNSYNPLFETPVNLVSKNNAVKVDNERGIITCVGGVSVSDFDTNAVKVVIDGNVLKAVTADGLAAKAYTIVADNFTKGFYNGENGAEIKTLAAAGNEVCFELNLDAVSLIDGKTPVVVLAVYDNEGNFIDSISAQGKKYTDEITKYKAVMDISAYNKAEIELRGFIWNADWSMKALDTVSILK